MNTSAIRFGLGLRVEKAVELALCFWLLACVLVFVIVSRHWPMVGDAIFMHYVVFLTRHGMAPYRDIIDMNLPGSYFLDACVMRIFGLGSVGWRVYDFVLLALSSASLMRILRPQGRLAGVLAASLFVLIHGRDGVLMSGERDFAAAVFLLCAVALLLNAQRGKFQGRWTPWSMSIFGVLLGICQTIKPTLLPMAVFLVAWVWWECRAKQNEAALLGRIIAGMLLPLLAVVLFLARSHALGAFWGELHSLIPYHSSLDPEPITFLVRHSISPLIGLFAIWLVTAALLGRTEDDTERAAMFLCALCGLLSYVLQRKGFWYQRYPFIAFLIPLFVSDFARLARRASRRRMAGIAGMLAGAVLTTQCLARLATFDHGEPARPILSDLSAFGIAQALSGHVQCMDTIGGCLDSLYAGKIVQSTGFLYDCYLLDGSNTVALGLRQRFWQAMDRNPPRLIVVTDSDCYDLAPSFNRFTRWPEFSTYLADNYTLVRTSGPQQPVHYWSRPLTPFAYRIYVRR